MALRQLLSHDPARAAALELLEELLGGDRPEELLVRLWDGSAWRPGHGRGPARVTLALKHPGTLRNMFSDPSDLTLGEAYIYDDCDLEGDIESIFTVIDRLFERGFSLVAKLRYAALLRRMPTRCAASGGTPGGARGRAALESARPQRRDFSLQPVKRFLPAVARPAHGVLVRIFPLAAGYAR